MPTAELPAVAMWYGERGHGDPCVLLHPGGAGVDSRALDPTVPALAGFFHVYTPEQRGHAGVLDGELAVVPGTSHGLLVEKPGMCNLVITEFLTKEPAQTFAPIRRAARKAP